MLRSSAASPGSEQTAISPLVLAPAQSKLGRAVVAAVGGWGTDGAVGATPFISGAMTFDSTGATGCGAGSATRDKVASGVMIASALRSTTTSPLPSAAGCTE